VSKRVYAQKHSYENSQIDQQMHVHLHENQTETEGKSYRHLMAYWQQIRQVRFSHSLYFGKINICQNTYYETGRPIMLLKHT